MSVLRADDPRVEAAVRFALTAGRQALAASKPSTELNPKVLSFLAAFWWCRLAGLLSEAAFERLTAEIDQAGLTEDEFFAVLWDRKAPAVTSLLKPDSRP